MNDEQFERDLRRVVDRAMRQQASPALHARVAETLATPPPRRHRWLAHGPALAAEIATALVLVAAAALVFLLHPSATPQIGASPLPTPTIRVVGPGVPASDAWSTDGRFFALDDVANGTPGQTLAVHLYARDGSLLRDIPGSDLAWIGARTFLVGPASSGGPVVASSLDTTELAPATNATFAGLAAPGHRVAAVELPWTDPTQARFVVWQSGTTSSPQQGIPLAWSPDGSLLAVMHVTQRGQGTGGEDAGWLQVLRVPDLTPVAAVHEPLIGDRGAFIFDASGRHLAYLGAILDVISGHVTTLNVGGVETVAWDGTRLLVAESQRERIAWFDASGSPLPGDLPYADRLSVSPSGMIATFDFGKGTVTLHDGTTTRTLDVCQQQVDGIAWAPDGTAFLANCEQADGIETVLVELSGPPGLAATPSATSTPQPSLAPAACRADQLAASAPFLMGAAGSMAGGIRIWNTSDSPCTLEGRPSVAIHDAEGHDLAVPNRPAPEQSPQPFVLPARQEGQTSPDQIVPGTGSVFLQWSDWCGTRPAEPLLFLLSVPGGGTLVSTGTVELPFCNDPAMSGLSVGSFVQVPGPGSASAPPSSAAASPPGVCQASQLRVHGGRMGGGTGTAQVDIAFTNVGTAPCTLAGDPTSIELLASDGSVLPTVAAAPGATPGPPVTLVPGATDAATLAFNWSNWCGGAPGAMRIRVTLPGRAGAVTGDLNGTPGTYVPRCDHPETASALELLWSFSATP